MHETLVDDFRCFKEMPVAVVNGLSFLLVGVQVLTACAARSSLVSRLIHSIGM